MNRKLAAGLVSVMLAVGIGTAHPSYATTGPVIKFTGNDLVRIDQQEERLGVQVLGVSGKVTVDFGDGTGSETETVRCTVKKAAKDPQRCSAALSHEYYEPGTYTISVTAGKTSASRTVTIADIPRAWTPPTGWVQPAGWKLLTGRATFTPCQRIDWYFDRSGEPADRAGAIDDVRAGLAVLAPVTGLTFTEVSDPAAAELKFGWADLGDISGRGGGWNGYGFVTLSTSNDWTRDRWAGLGRPSFSWTDESGSWTWAHAGRGWLVVHETMHALGLGHVDDPTQVMNPVGADATALGAGDLDGLATLYLNNPCPLIP